MPRRLVSFCAPLLLVLAASACGDDDDAEAGAPDSDDKIDWSSCHSGLQCAEVEVPLDYDTPNGEEIKVSVLRVPATGARSERIGPLFVNPGGPGAKASDFAKKVASALPDAVTKRFDIVGVDPRGLGASKISCGDEGRNAQAADYTIDSDAEKQAVIDVNQAYVQSCQTNVGSELRQLGTREVARDMDRVRAAMGEDQLSYLGFSYGTALGQVYAQEFPNQVRAMVFDGVADLGPSGIDFATAQAAGFEQALADWAQECAADDTCALKVDPIGTVDQLSAQVQQAPIPAQPRPLGPADLSRALSANLYSELGWRDLSDGVAAGLAGDGSKLMASVEDMAGEASFDVYNSVFCTDWAWPTQPDEILAAGAAARATAPHFGEPIVNDYVRCALWPVQGSPLAVTDASTRAPVVVVATTKDPATPYVGATDTARKLGATLLTFDGEGHGAIGAAVPCIDDAVAAFLVDLTLPAAGTTCARG